MFLFAYGDTIEDYALSQIQILCDNEAFKECRVRVMTDVHPGKEGYIYNSKKGAPSVVGIDIGCGITIARLKQKKVEFQRQDKVIRENVPAGFHIRKKPHRFHDMITLGELRCRHHVNENKAVLSLGTLGGRNHFIELVTGTIIVQLTKLRTNACLN
nr:hypothetical protein [uncultured Blautia sp.]